MGKMEMLLPLVDKVDGLAMAWQPWMERLIAGCGGMKAPVWPIPQWMPTKPGFDPGEIVRKYFENVDDLASSDDVARKKAARRDDQGRISARLAEGTLLAGLPQASGKIAGIKARFYGCIAEIYQYEQCFRGMDTEVDTFPLGLQTSIQHALRYALVLVAIGGRRHISEDELDFVQLLTLHTFRSAYSTPA